MSKRLRLSTLLISWLFITSCGRQPDNSISSTPSGVIPPGAIPAASQPAIPVIPTSTLPVPAPLSMGQVPGSFAPLAQRADPAVATVKATVARGRRRAEGLGTAFVYDPDGFLLTNNHVIEGATDILISFVDSRELIATVAGQDKHTDVAVLKVEERDLPSLPLGDSDAIQVGDWVVAIGNPFGLAHTVSAGILSAKGRTRDDVKGLDPSGYFDFLQTDASINPGNSGGPLLNLKGEVVGINAAIRAQANNIGFAIPINMVKQLLPMLLRDGKITRSAIGVLVDFISPLQAERLKRPDRKGALVKTVVPGGPADRAGLASDDVIVAFDGKSISDPNELRWLASIAGVNKVVTLRIARLDRVFDVRVTLGELQELPTNLGDEP